MRKKIKVEKIFRWLRAALNTVEHLSLSLKRNNWPMKSKQNNEKYQMVCVDRETSIEIGKRKYVPSRTRVS